MTSNSAPVATDSTKDFRHRNYRNPPSCNSWDNQISKSIVTMYTSSLLNERKFSNNTHRNLLNIDYRTIHETEHEKHRTSTHKSTMINHVHGSRNLIIKRNNGDKRTIRIQSNIIPVWFSSSSEEIFPNWENLQNGHAVQKYLDNLFDQQQLNRYIHSLFDILNESILMANHDDNKSLTNFQRSSIRQSILKYSKGMAKSCPITNHIQRQEDSTMTSLNFSILWCQFFRTVNAFASLEIERSNFLNAFDILKFGCKLDEIELYTPDRTELRGYFFSTLGLYYYRRNMFQCSLEYCLKAKTCFETLSDYFGIASTLVHIICVTVSLAKYEYAHEEAVKFFQLIENGCLDVNKMSQKILSLVAVAYNNLAVIQLRLGCPQMALESSINARKVSRLCLSFSTRWISLIEKTYDIAVEDLKYKISSESTIYNVDFSKREFLLKLVDTLEQTYDVNPIN